MVSEFKYNQIVDGLLENQYRVLSNKDITVTLTVSNDTSNLNAQVKSNPFKKDKYNIAGYVPRNILQDENLDTIVKGLLAHEFSHISLGHSVFMRNVRDYLLTSLEYLGFSWLVGNGRLESLEKAADEDVIKRGLGKELLFARYYLEEVDGVGHSCSYSVDELTSLIISQTSI